LFFPIGLSELEALSGSIGYDFAKELRDRLPEVPKGMRLSMAGPIATKTKDGYSLRVDMEKGVVAIQGSDIEGVLQDFESLEKHTKEVLRVSLEDEARFYEFILDAEAVFTDGRNPIQEISNLFAGAQVFDQLSPIVGEPLTNFGLRLVPKDLSPNGDIWVDFRIEPSIAKPTSVYSINTVLRNTARSIVIEQARSVGTKLRQIIDLLRGTS